MILESESPLTREQSRFAEENGARAGVKSLAASGAIFLYRDDAFGTDRWLVDGRGSVLDIMRFHKSPG